MCILFILACNCHGHADACVYNVTVDAEKRSLNARGEYEGGGVCLNCKVKKNQKIIK